MRTVNASSYNAYREQLAMEDLVKFTPPKEDKNGSFSSLLPIKPYNIGSIRDNQESADKYNLALKLFYKMNHEDAKWRHKNKKKGVMDLISLEEVKFSINKLLRDLK